MAEVLVNVAIPLRVDGAFTYLVDEPTAKTLSTGSVLEVSFGRQSVHGFVVGFPEETQLEFRKLKPIKYV